MTKEELMAKVDFKPVQISGVERVKLSTKLTPYQDNERDFCGYRRCTSNVLAQKNDAAAMAMCKD